MAQFASNTMQVSRHLLIVVMRVSVSTAQTDDND